MTNKNNDLLKVGIIDETSYSQAKRKIGTNFIENKLETVFGLSLAKNPLYGIQLQGTNNVFYFSTTAFGINSPAFRFLYVYDPITDSKNILLKSVGEIENSNQEES